MEAQNQRLRLIVTDTNLDNDFDYPGFMDEWNELMELSEDYKENKRQIKELMNNLYKRGSQYTEQFINKVDNLGSMSPFYLDDFFPLVDELDLQHFAQLSSNPAQGKENPVYEYEPDVFLNTSWRSRFRYMVWVGHFIEAFYKLLERHQRTLKKEIQLKVKGRAHLLFSGYLPNHVFFPILTTHHIKQFITLAKKDARIFQEVSSRHQYMTYILPLGPIFEVSDNSVATILSHPFNLIILIKIPYLNNNTILLTIPSRRSCRFLLNGIINNIFIFPTNYWIH